MSLAILFAHPDFRVSAMSADEKTFGIVQPHVGNSCQTAAKDTHLCSERYLLEMRGVPFRATLKPGAVVFSSGLGGIYPKGIPVGVVLGEIKTTEAWARTYLLRPAVNPAELTSVMILTPQRATAGLQNVWADVASVDSATRSIVVAGDSLARRSAEAEAAARRAAIDSAARTLGDSLRRDTTARVDSAGRAAALPGAPPARPRVTDSTAARIRRDSVARARAAANSRNDTTRRDTIPSGARP
jgi:rod shape-determining protein MreC